MNRQHKDVYLDSETKKNWDNPTGYMDGGYSHIYFTFEDGMKGSIYQTMTLEPDDILVYELLEDGKVVEESFYDYLDEEMKIVYNNTEYTIRLTEGDYETVCM